ARRRAMAALVGFGVTIVTGFRVVDVRRQGDAVLLASSSGKERHYAHVFWCTAASAAGWPGDAGLDCDERGFISVNKYLQSVSHHNVFAAGDIASLQHAPRPKAGVYAVRQGPVLAENLRRYLLDEALKPFKPQSGFLSLLSTGDGSAVGDWRGIGFRGRWVWRLKDRIDRTFIRRFEELPTRDMDSAANAVPGNSADAAAFDMRCGGCGGKLPADMLSRVLGGLAGTYPEVVAAPETGDDAARIDLEADGILVQSVDVLRELVDDPYLMGRIAVNHALSDLYAMGAQPLSAQAIVHLPYGGESVQERDLLQLMTGAAVELASAGCTLVGGHSLEGSELSLGFVVNGQSCRDLTTKAGAGPGDRLLLAKPLGLGALHAAHRQLKLNSRMLPAAEAIMLLSNAGAAKVAREFNATAVTDITGFGLVGHLLEMLRDRTLSAEVDLSEVPVLPGVLECFGQGVFSTAQAANARAASQIDNWHAFEGRLETAVLFDPQTSGGLLLAVPENLATECLQALILAGYTSAADIGQIQSGNGGINLI
ncbi:MAG: selenide,water dikinase, partial [Halieaceae bacterium]